MLFVRLWYCTPVFPKVNPSFITKEIYHYVTKQWMGLLQKNRQAVSASYPPPTLTSEKVDVCGWGGGGRSRDGQRGGRLRSCSSGGTSRGYGRGSHGGRSSRSIGISRLFLCQERFRGSVGSGRSRYADKPRNPNATTQSQPPKERKKQQERK